jgi:site-specific DNA-methyltransferase (adenine-specific)
LPADRSIAANDSESATIARPSLRELVRSTIVDAFYAAHDGFSIDWLLANPVLQNAFHVACREAGLIGSPADWNRELLRLRKTGGFPRRGKIKKATVSDEEMDAYNFAAEIAWRLTSDTFGQPSLDEILCDPEKAFHFDRAAKRFGPGFEPSQYRWAALRLRKASRDLINDMKQYHFVFARRDFGRYQNWKRFESTRLGGRLGIYLLRGWAKESLFIGATLDLGRRLAQHAVCRTVLDSVAQVAIISDDELPGKDYCAAFKEDLVRRYQPKWNVSLVGLHGAVAG